MANYSDFKKLSTIQSEKIPFPHLLCSDFIPTEALTAIHRDFPKVPAAGSFPLSTLNGGKAFAALIDEIRSAKMAQLLGDKLGADLSDRPTMVTVRGFCRATDGKIHLDSGGKLVTVLLYLNTDWDKNTGGRLRLLHDDKNIDNYFLESPPGNGTLLAFRCDDNAWHGHLPYAGERRAIQLNWVASKAYHRREAVRHVVSATLKKARAVFKKTKHH